MAGARATDPHTSLLAAIQAESSGSASSQRAKILEAVKQQPGRTSAEIAIVLGMERHVPARRLKEIEAKGLISRGPARRCTACGNLCVTWTVRGNE